MDDRTREHLVVGARAEAARLRGAATSMAGLRQVRWEGESGEAFRESVIRSARALVDAAEHIEAAAAALAQRR